MTDKTYYIGVDGGGTGTRVKILNSDKQEIGYGEGRTSALSLGRRESWDSIEALIKRVFKQINNEVPHRSQCHIGLGLSGANNLKWKEEFLTLNPGYKSVVLESDGLTTLLGAYDGAPGAIIALGTGSIGMAKNKKGELKSVSGWGYPSGDEASGSWLGMHVLRYTEKVMDGRKKPSRLSQLIQKECGETPEDLLDWLGKAKAKDYALLSPLVFQAAKEGDKCAKYFLDIAIQDIEDMIQALDPEQNLSLAFCGKLGQAFVPLLSEKYKKRIMAPQGSSIDGALKLALNEDHS